MFEIPPDPKKFEGRLSGTPGLILINPGMCFPSFSYLIGKFNIIRFLNFCNGIEACILHDNLIIVRNNYDFDNSVLNVLLKDGIIKQSSDCVIFDEYSFGEMFYDIYGKCSDYGRKITTNETLRHILWDTTMSHEPEFSVTWNHEIPIVAPASYFPYYRIFLKTDNKFYNKLSSSLSEKYKELSHYLLSLRESVGESFIRIPPLALEAFLLADSLSNLGEAVLDIREKYKNLRKSFFELESIMLSDDLKLIKKLKEKAKLQKAISFLYPTSAIDNVEIIHSFATGLNNVAEINGVLKDGLDLSDIKLTKIIDLLLKEANNVYWKFQLNPLHGTKKKKSSNIKERNQRSYTKVLQPYN